LSPHEELFALSAKLKEAAFTGNDDEIGKSLAALESASLEIGKSFSGSWQGYHSRVYYLNFSTPPPGAHFSQEWGLKDDYMSGLGSRGDWREYDSESVKDHIRKKAGNPDLSNARSLADAAAEVFEFSKSELISILLNALDDHDDSFLKSLKEQLEKLKPMSPFEITQARSPKGQFMTRDTVVFGQGVKVPPHVAVLSEALSIRQSFGICSAAAEIAAKAASHLERKSKKQKVVERIGTNVFIGHGRSEVWRNVKDFVQDRLNLPWDEFNRVPFAGITNIARLSEMLDASAVAFLVMTAEDEMADGALQARMNVVHEAGLFQGRLGFTKAIILLEEGCQEFSNIQGLGQIRFPRGNISAVFEEIRRVLEREGLIN